MSKLTLLLALVGFGYTGHETPRTLTVPPVATQAPVKGTCCDHHGPAPGLPIAQQPIVQQPSAAQLIAFGRNIEATSRLMDVVSLTITANGNQAMKDKWRTVRKEFVAVLDEAAEKAPYTSGVELRELNAAVSAVKLVVEVLPVEDMAALEKVLAQVDLSGKKKAKAPLKNNNK